MKQRSALRRVEDRAASGGHFDLPAEGLRGRAAELAALESWWSGEEALGVLVGPPGAGKTRLGLHFAGLRQARWARLAVWTVNLQQARTPEGVVDAAVSALGIAGAVHQPLEVRAERVAGWLAQQAPALVFLDNLEQLSAEATALVQRWSEASAEVRWLATTRRREQLAAPHVEIGPLNLEREGDAALALLLDAAARARPGYRPQQRELETLEQIVELLEGLPQALMLAGSRLALISPAELACRLSDILTTLDRPGQARSLRDGIAASWRLLEPSEQQALRQCVVFHGAFDLEAAEAVLKAPGLGVLEVLHRLYESSLLEVQRSSEGSRYSVLASIRAFAADQGELAVDTAQRHAAFYSQAARALVRQVESEAGSAALERLLALREQLCGVLTNAQLLPDDARRAVAGSVADAALALELIERLQGGASNLEAYLSAAAALLEEPGASAPEGRYVRLQLARWQLYRAQGRRAERLAALQAALAAPCDDPDAAALAWRCQAIELWSRREMAEAAEAIQRALEATRQAPSEVTLAQLLIAQAWLALEGGQTAEVLRQAEQALALLASAGAEHLYSLESVNLGQFLAQLGAIDAAQARFQETLERCRRKGSRVLEMHLTRALGSCQMLLGEPGASALLQRAAALASEQGAGQIADVAVLQGWQLRLTQGSGAAALAQLRRAVALRRQAGIPRMLAFTLQDLAILALDLGDLALTGEALREGLTLVRVGMAPTQEALWVGLEAILAAHRGEVAEAERLILRQQQLKAALEHPRFSLGADLDQATVACLLGQGEAPEVAAALVAALRPEPPPWGLPGAPRPLWQLSRGMRAGVRRLLAAAPPAVLQRAWAAALDPEARGLVAAGGDAYQLPGGAWVELSSAPTLARVFGALVEARRAGSTEGLSVEALVEAGWPDEQILPDAAANRLHQVIARLRRMGLREVLASGEGGGYRLPLGLAVGAAAAV